MHAAVIVAIVFGSIIIILTILAMTGLAIIRLFRGGGKTHGGLDDEEARSIQEIYQGLSRMEARVEALETLLLEKERKDK